jgi:hypothetical protein
MIRFISIFAVALAFAGTLHAQVPSAQLKVRESGLFGLKGERSARVELSSINHALPLTDSSINAGQYYYFLFSPTGHWTLEDRKSVV